MAQTHKTVKIPIKVNLGISGPFIEEGAFVDLVNYAGGQLAVALFRGDFRSELNSMLQMAYYRGRADYHKQLLNESK